MSESDIIRSLVEDSVFIGDDAALLPKANGVRHIISKDLLIQDVHFRTEYFTYEDLAHKALHVNLSDIAAMGGSPLYVLCGISIPKDLQDYGVKFLKVLSLICKKLGILLIGGDTTKSNSKLFISITIIGSIKESEIKYRNRSQIGDVICVIGDIGFANLGFLALENNYDVNFKYIDRFLRPKAKIKEGNWLAKCDCVRSMIDVSDGLYIDLKKLCCLSKKGAILELDLLEKHLPQEISLNMALEGGEDYSLLLTIAYDSYKYLSKKFLKVFGYEMKKIGRITEGNQIKFLKNEEYVKFPVEVFEHFK